MPYTFGALKAELRETIFADGEAPNHVKAHDKSFIDAMMDLQKWVECLQQDNINTFPHCATYYQCGLTVFPAPRGRIFRVSVIDKINPDTGLEDATAEDEWCSELIYSPVSFDSIRKYLDGVKYPNSCIPLHLCLGLSYPICRKTYPTPTDEGVPAGLPSLPMGFHYAQGSTDSVNGRAQGGMWAMDRGKIYIAPWIQSTETVVVKWNGIKRTWVDSDIIDDDPLLKRAVRAWVMADHFRDWDMDLEQAAVMKQEYAMALQDLIHECREETRSRAGAYVGSEGSGSGARGSAESVTSLYYNEEQTATAHCPDGTTGSVVSSTVAAGVVASTISVADANAKAYEEAQRRATAQLDCEDVVVTYYNTAVERTATCTTDADHPDPDGEPVTARVEAGEVSSTVSQAEADANATALALSRAQAQLQCTYWNKEVSATAECPNNDGPDVTETVDARQFSADTQEGADQLASAEALKLATDALVCLGGLTRQYCDEQIVYKSQVKPAGGLLTVRVVVKVCFLYAATKLEANYQAHAIAQAEFDRLWYTYVKVPGDTFKETIFGTDGMCP